MARFFFIFEKTDHVYKIDFYKPVLKEYTEIQKLKKFLALAASVGDYTNNHLTEIIFLIENINKPSTYKNWNICLEIRDLRKEMLHGKINDYYIRSWSVYFENNRIEITATSNHTDIFFEPEKGAHFYYHQYYFFEKKLQKDYIPFYNDIDSFIEDAKQYKKYCTKHVNNIDITICVDE